MTTINVDVSGDAEAFASFRWTQIATTFADEWGPKILGALRAEAPVAPIGGGRLRNRLSFERHTTVGFLSMLFTDDVPYFPYVVHGTEGGQLIQPVATRALHWVSNGQDVFATSVIRGATPKNDFPTRVWDSMREMVQQGFRDAVREGMGLE